MVSAKSHASNGICSETFHKILSANGIKERCTIFGGSDSHTRDMFCLPQDVPLPLRHYKIAFPVKVDVKAVISSFKMAIGEDIGNHTICPEAASGSRKEHMFFVFMSSNLKSSLEESYQNDEQTKQHISVVYEASQPIINTSSDITPSQRLCALVLLYSFIMFTANAQALRTRGTCSGPLKDIDIALKKDCKRSKSQILREAQRSLLKKAYAAYQSNLQQPQDSTATGVANPQEHGSPSSSRCNKRERPLDLDDAVQHDVLRPVQSKMVLGDGTSDMPPAAARGDNVFDVSPDPILLYQDTHALDSLLGFDGLLDEDILQNSTPGTPLLANNQDGLFMESYDPFAEADLSMFNNGEYRSL